MAAPRASRIERWAVPRLPDWLRGAGFEVTSLEVSEPDRAAGFEAILECHRDNVRFRTFVDGSKKWGDAAVLVCLGERCEQVEEMLAEHRALVSRPADP